MNKRPNIVIFNPDQWRGDVLGHLGHRAAITPNLDRLVDKDGVSFRNAFCQNPMCTPSRCSFMTGWYPHVHGHRSMSYMLHSDEPVLLKTLKDSGYYVWWGGKNDLIPAQNGYADYCNLKYAPPEEETRKPTLGFPDEWRGAKDADNYYSFYAGKLTGDSLSGEYTDHDWSMVRGAISFIEQYNGDTPFCLYLPLHYPHPPYAAEEPWYSLINREDVPPRSPLPDKLDLEPGGYQAIREIQQMESWSESRWTELQATYYAACARVDHQFGMVMDALKNADCYEDTAVFFFSDHGDFTGDYGVVQKADNVFPECLPRVLFIIKPPRNIPVRPRISEALVELIDFPATVEALVGIVPHHPHFGKSLLPLLADEVEHRDAVFCEGGRRYGEEACKGLELIPEPVEDNLYWSILKSFRTESPAMGKAVMIRTRDFKYVYRLYESDELYNLRNDPREITNRIHDPTLGDILAQLRRRLLAFYLETTDVVFPVVDVRE